MKESSAMLEIRKIKDENSLRYLEMPTDELAKKLDESAKLFIEEMEKRGKKVKFAPRPQ